MKRIAVLLLFLALAFDGHACTTFCMNVNGHVVFGANYDWDTGVAAMMVNKRSVMKESYTLRPLHWISRYASITVNQYGREFPSGGMNEAGLVVGLMALDETQYPAVDERPSAGVLDWIQYQLDVSGDIDEAVANAGSIRVATGSKGVHFLLADRSGRAVTIEYLGGVLVTHRDAALPSAVLANHNYDQSLAYLRNITGFGGAQPVPNGIGSLERFARAASMIRTTSPGAHAVDRAFAILEAVHQPNFTRWRIVYDPAAATVYFRTDQNLELRWVSFASFDGACASAVQMLDANTQESGDVAPFFADYTTAANLALVNRAYDETPFLRNTSEAHRVEVAMHGESGTCVVPRRLRSVRH